MHGTQSRFPTIADPSGFRATSTLRTALNVRSEIFVTRFVSWET